MKTKRSPQSTIPAPLRSHQRERRQPTDSSISSAEGASPTAYMLLEGAGLLERTWSTAQGSLTSEMLLHALLEIRTSGRATANEVGLAMRLECPPSTRYNWIIGTDRRTDRALQLLKRAGLIVFDKGARAWRATR